MFNFYLQWDDERARFTPELVSVVIEDAADAARLSVADLRAADVVFVVSDYVITSNDMLIV